MSPSKKKKKIKLQCFVISPIGQPDSQIREDANATLEYIIRPAMELIESDGGPSIRAVRSDEMGDPGRIEEQMIDAILTYDLCIADLTGHNPNVFYELAIAQCAGRPVVLLCKEDYELPFDVKDYRTIIYNLKPKSIKEDIWVRPLADQILAALNPRKPQPSLLNGRVHTDSNTKSYLLNSKSKEFGDAPRYREIVRSTAERCDLLGISLRAWAYKDSIKVLEELGERGIRTRIMIMHSENPALGAMINEDLARESTQSIKDHVNRMAAFFSKMADKYPSFEFRVIQKGTPHAQLIITDYTALILHYMYSRGTEESPILQFPGGTTLHEVFLDEFEELWRINGKTN